MALTTGAGAARGREGGGLGRRGQRAGAVLEQEQHGVTLHGLRLPSGPWEPGAATSPRVLPALGSPRPPCSWLPTPRGKARAPGAGSRAGTRMSVEGERAGETHGRLEAAAENTGQRAWRRGQRLKGLRDTEARPAGLGAGQTARTLPARACSRAQESGAECAEPHHPQPRPGLCQAPATYQHDPQGHRQQGHALGQQAPGQLTVGPDQRGR